MNKPVCKRCGKCCYLQTKDGEYTTTKCKYLVIIGNGMTSCRIYKNRLGTKLDEYNTCMPRESINKNIEGCPYNKKEE